MSDQYNPFEPVRSFFFGNAPADSPLSYQGLQTRRKIAEQLMGRRSPFPKNLGEGLTYLGESLGDRMALADLDRREAAQAGYEDKRLNELRGYTEPSADRAAGAQAPSITAAPPPAAVRPEMPAGGSATASLRAPSTYREADTSTQFGVPESTFSDPMTGQAPRGNAGMAPLANAQRFMPTITNPATGNAVIAGQIPSQAFGSLRSYGALPIPAGNTAGDEGGGAPPLGPALPDPRAIVAAPADVRLAASTAALPPTTGPALPPTPSIEKAPDLLPSRERIPPASPPYQTVVPPEPVRPQPLPLSPREIYLNGIISDRRLDPEGATVRAAKQELDYRQGQRKELEAQAQENYTHLRGLRDTALALQEKRKFDEPSQAQAEYLKRLEAEIKQADAQNQPVIAAKLRTDLAQAVRTLTKPETFMARETQYQQQYDPATGRLGPAAVTPGAPAPEEKALTAGQADAVNFATSVKPDLEDIKTKLNHGQALTSLRQNVLEGWVPGGHALTSQAYHETTNKLGSFAAAFLKMRSGANVTPSEAIRTLPSVMPQFGDSQADLEDKSRRRDLIVEGSLAGGGTAARKVVDETLAEFSRSQGRPVPENNLPPARPKTLQEAQQLPAGRRFISPATGKEYTAHGQSQ